MNIEQFLQENQNNKNISVSKINGNQIEFQVNNEKTIKVEDKTKIDTKNNISDTILGTKKYFRELGNKLFQLNLQNDLYSQIYKQLIKIADKSVKKSNIIDNVWQKNHTDNNIIYFLKFIFDSINDSNFEYNFNKKSNKRDKENDINEKIKNYLKNLNEIKENNFIYEPNIKNIEEFLYFSIINSPKYKHIPFSFNLETLKDENLLFLEPQTYFKNIESVAQYFPKISLNYKNILIEKIINDIYDFENNCEDIEIKRTKEEITKEITDSFNNLLDGNLKNNEVFSLDIDISKIIENISYQNKINYIKALKEVNNFLNTPYQNIDEILNNLQTLRPYSIFLGNNFYNLFHLEYRKENFSQLNIENTENKEFIIKEKDGNIHFYSLNDLLNKNINNYLINNYVENIETKNNLNFNYFNLPQNQLEYIKKVIYSILTNKLINIKDIVDRNIYFNNDDLIKIFIKDKGFYYKNEFISIQNFNINHNFFKVNFYLSDLFYDKHNYYINNFNKEFNSKYKKFIDIYHYLQLNQIQNLNNVNIEDENLRSLVLGNLNNSFLEKNKVNNINSEIYITLYNNLPTTNLVKNEKERVELILNLIKFKQDVTDNLKDFNNIDYSLKEQLVIFKNLIIYDKDYYKEIKNQNLNIKSNLIREKINSIENTNNYAQIVFNDIREPFYDFKNSLLRYIQNNYEFNEFNLNILYKELDEKRKLEFLTQLNNNVYFNEQDKKELLEFKKEIYFKKIDLLKVDKKLDDTFYDFALYILNNKDYVKQIQEYLSIVDKKYTIFEYDKEAFNNDNTIKNEYIDIYAKDLAKILKYFAVNNFRNLIKVYIENKNILNQLTFNDFYSPLKDLTIENNIYKPLEKTNIDIFSVFASKNFKERFLTIDENGFIESYHGFKNELKNIEKIIDFFRENKINIEFSKNLNKEVFSQLKTYYIQICQLNEYKLETGEVFIEKIKNILKINIDSLQNLNKNSNQDLILGNLNIYTNSKNNINYYNNIDNLNTNNYHFEINDNEKENNQIISINNIYQNLNNFNLLNKIKFDINFEVKNIFKYNLKNIVENIFEYNLQDINKNYINNLEKNIKNKFEKFFEQNSFNQNDIYNFIKKNFYFYIIENLSNSSFNKNEINENINLIENIIKNFENLNNVNLNFINYDNKKNIIKLINSIENNNVNILNNDKLIKEIVKEIKDEEFKLRYQTKSTRIGAGTRIEINNELNVIREMLGVNAVQLGKWLEKDKFSRPLHFNGIVNGFNDLSQITGIALSQIGLNQSLQLTIGSEGDAKCPIAHYDSLLKTLNITKYNGYGALGHEYFHALDNLLIKFIYSPELAKKLNVKLLTDIVSLNINGLNEENEIFISNNPIFKEYAKLVFTMKYNCSYKKEQLELNVNEDARKIANELIRCYLNIDSLENVASNLNYFSKYSNTIKYLIYSDKNDLNKKEYFLKVFIQNCLNFEKNDFQSIINEANYFSLLNIENKDTQNYYSFLSNKRNKYYDYLENRSAFNEYLIPQDLIIALCIKNANDGIYNINFKSIEKVNFTNYFENAKNLDKNSTKKTKEIYWAQNTEMGARAFSCFLNDKLLEKNQLNYYLCGITYNNDIDKKPYPEHQERININKQMESLFKVISQELNLNIENNLEYINKYTIPEEFLDIKEKQELLLNEKNLVINQNYNNSNQLLHYLTNSQYENNNLSNVENNQNIENLDKNNNLSNVENNQNIEILDKNNNLSNVENNQNLENLGKNNNLSNVENNQNIEILDKNNNLSNVENNQNLENLGKNNNLSNVENNQNLDKLNKNKDLSDNQNNINIGNLIENENDYQIIQNLNKEKIDKNLNNLYENFILLKNIQENLSENSKIDRQNLKNLIYHITNDRKLILNSLKFNENINLIHYINKNYLKDNNFLYSAIINNKEIIKKIDISYLDKNKDLIKRLLEKDKNLLEFMPPHYKKDPKILEIINSDKQKDFVLSKNTNNNINKKPKINKDNLTLDLFKNM